MASNSRSNDQTGDLFSDGKAAITRSISPKRRARSLDKAILVSMFCQGFQCLYTPPAKKFSEGENHIEVLLRASGTFPKSSITACWLDGGHLWDLRLSVLFCRS